MSSYRPVQSTAVGKAALHALFRSLCNCGCSTIDVAAEMVEPVVKTIANNFVVDRLPAEAQAFGYTIALEIKDLYQCASASTSTYLHISAAHFSQLEYHPRDMHSSASVHERNAPTRSRAVQLFERQGYLIAT